MITTSPQGLLVERPFQIFWTPYDPLDLATGSLDPLGFARGYLGLADRFLPTFTTVTTIPRYVSMLCAALAAAGKDVTGQGEAPGRLRQERLRRVKAFERAWALACTLASRQESVGVKAVQGLRGIRSVNRRLDSLADHSRSVQTNSFNLLANQVRYGGLGIHSTFLDECHLAFMQSLTLRPLGEELANAFPSPPHGLRVHDEDARLPLEDLTEWGVQAHVACFTKAEGAVLAVALRGGDEEDHADRVRWTSLRLIAAVRAGTAPDEQSVLRAVADKLRNGGFGNVNASRDCLGQIAAALHVLEPFERLYQGVLFLFETLRGAASDNGEASLEVVGGAGNVKVAIESLRESVTHLHRALDETKEMSPSTAAEVMGVFEVSGIIALAGAVAQHAGDQAELLRTIIRRHEQVQGGKFDRGIPKAPWVRLASEAGAVHLTAQRHQLAAASRPAQWTDAPRHPYRTRAGFAFIDQCRIR